MSILGRFDSINEGNTSKRKEIIDKVAVFKSTERNENSRKKYSDDNKEYIEGNKDSTSFLYTLFKTINGVLATYLIIADIIKKTAPIIESYYKEQIIKKYQNLPNSNQPISNLSCLNNASIDISLSHIDKFNIFKYNPTSSEDVIVQKLRECLQTGAVVSLTPSLNIEYDEVLNIIKTTSTSSSTTNDVLENELVPLLRLDINNIMNEVIDEIFGLNSKTLNDLLNQNKRDAVLKRLLEYDSVTIYDFDFKQIQNRTYNQYNNSGLTLNLCGVTKADVDNGLINELKTIDYTQLTETQISEKLNEVFSRGENTNSEQTKDFINLNIIEKIKIIFLSKMLLSPSFIYINTLYTTLNSSSCTPIETTNFVDDLDDSIVNCVLEELKNQIYQVFFDRVSTDIQRLISSYIRKLLREKTQNTQLVLSTLIS